jgi:hypothetical protein
MNVQTPHGFNVLHSRDVLTHLDLMNVDVMPIMSGMVSNVNVSLPILFCTIPISTRGRLLESRLANIPRLALNFKANFPTAP